MSGIVIFILGFVVLFIAIASLWYLFQTVRVMWAYNSLLAIAAVFLSPLVHIVFYFVPKDGFDQYDKGLFKKYFISIGALMVLGVVAAVLIPAIESKTPIDAMADDVNLSKPWDWDIRAENQEEVATQIESNGNDAAKAVSLHYDAIYQVHPDADSIVNSPEYALWLQGKTAEEQDRITVISKEGNASEVIYILSIFKKDLADYRANEYQMRRENAQALAQTQYQEKRSRELETNKSNAQRRQDQRQQQITEYAAANRTPETTAQAAPTERALSHNERMERENVKALVSKPLKGARGLTSSQTEQLLALDRAPAPPSQRGYNERMEHEKKKALISTPHKGMNGELTRAQRDALVSLETGQPMPSR